LRVCIVAVVQNGQSSDLHQLAPAARDGKPLEGLSYLVLVEAECLGHCPDAHRVFGLVQAASRQDETPPSHAHDRPGRFIERHGVGDQVGAAEGGGPHLPGPLPGSLRQRGWIDADDREWDPHGEPQLFLDDTSQGAEAFQVSGHRVGDNRDVWFDDLAVSSDLSWQVGARLDDHGLGIGWSLEDSEGNAHQVVEVRPGRIGPVPGAQDRGEHLLGARLSIGAGDGDDRTGEAPAAGPRQEPEPAQWVIDLIQTESRDWTRAAPNDGPTGARRGHLRQIVMSVEAVALQRHKESTWNDGAAVGRDAAEGLVPGAGVGRETESRANCRLGPGVRDGSRTVADHRRPLTASWTMTRSSKSIFVVPMTW
jgi:hypothetical protein